MVDGKKSIKGNKDWTKIGVIVSIILGVASLALSVISVEKSSESSQNFNELFANKSEKRNEFLRLIEADIKKLNLNCK